VVSTPQDVHNHSLCFELRPPLYDEGKQTLLTQRHTGLLFGFVTIERQIPLKVGGFSSRNISSPIFDLSSVRDHKVDAKGFNSHAAIHHSGEQERPLFIDRVPVFANEIQDFPRFVAVRRHSLGG
jgi:hypothetical protein